MYRVLSARRVSCRSDLLGRECPRRILEDALQPRGPEQGSRPHLLHPAQPGRLCRLDPIVLVPGKRAQNDRSARRWFKNQPESGVWLGPGAPATSRHVHRLPVPESGRWPPGGLTLDRAARPLDHGWTLWITPEGTPTLLKGRPGGMGGGRHPTRPALSPPASISAA